jgi:hypothetical protein
VHDLGIEIVAAKGTSGPSSHPIHPGHAAPIAPIVSGNAECIRPLVASNAEDYRRGRFTVRRIEATWLDPCLFLRFAALRRRAAFAASMPPRPELTASHSSVVLLPSKGCSHAAK